MGTKELFRRLEIEAHRSKKAHPVDQFLPKPEEWETQLEKAEEEVYKPTSEDVAGLDVGGGSVSLEEILDKEIPEDQIPTTPSPSHAPSVPTEDELADFDLGGSVSLEELLGEEFSQKPPQKPNGENLATKISSTTPVRDLSLEDILDELVPDEEKPKKKK